MAIGIMTLSITKLGTMTLSIMTLSKMTLGIMPLDLTTLVVTLALCLSANTTLELSVTQHNGILSFSHSGN
jgi:hypothetical protein